MVITPDNKTLIVSESVAGRLTAFDISADGSLSNRRIWAEGLGPDGICMDQEGAIWAQTPDSPRGAIVRIREGERFWSGSTTTAPSSPQRSAALTAKRYS